MKWAQALINDQPRAIAIEGNKIYSFGVPLRTILDGAGLGISLDQALAEYGGQEVSGGLDSLKLTQPLSDVQRVLCVGLNYRDHAAEVGADIPEFPTIFTKFGNSLIGPGDEIRLPLESTKMDWESELALVIGKPARRVSEDEALDYVAGYTILNDVSVRDWQGRTSEWFQGKNWDGITPWGPYIVPTAELDPVTGLAISCTIDGEKRQDGTTADQIFSPTQVVSYLSTFMTLEPGDIITTGTPAGVGLSIKPRKWLTAGQTVECEIEGIGVLKNKCGEPS